MFVPVFLEQLKAIKMRLTGKREEYWLSDFNQYILDNIGESYLTTDSIAAYFGISRRQLYRKVKALTNQTPHDYLNQIRFQKAYEHLEQGTYETVAETARAVGFTDPVYFARKFKSRFGMLPSEV